MKPFPMTELVIEELEANDKEEGRAIAKQLIKLAKDGNAAMLKVLYDRVQPASIQIEEEEEPLTHEQRMDRVLRLFERAGARRTQPATRS
jgi:hypothetical protein